MADRQPGQQQQQHPGQFVRPPSARTDSKRSNASTTKAVKHSETGATAHAQTSVPQSSTQPFFRLPQTARSTASESHAKAAKVAIPRLKRPSEAASEGTGRGGSRHRVNHACEPCRHRKTKCSGEQPICRHCQDFKIACYYADGKRDRVKKQFGTMAEKVLEYESLLKHLMVKVPEDDAALIKASLDRAAQTDVDDAQNDATSLQSIEIDPDVDEEPSGAESDVSAGAGSIGSLDRTDEDFTRQGARATGFLGKNSEVTWLQKLKQDNEFSKSPTADVDEEQTVRKSVSKTVRSKTGATENGIPLSEAADGFSIKDSSYHLDDMSISTYEAVDAYEMPTTETAQILLTTYMRRVHPTFPIVGQVNLTVQFQRFLQNPSQRPPEKWLAIVNLIFAIGAKYSHLVQADWKGDERDHIIYFTRARLLAVTHDALFEHPDLQQIQILGLMSFYLLCTSQVNRAWTLAGCSIRAAISLGLNLRNDSTNLRDSLKEIRYRLWWSLYSLEHRLCSLTGRANCIPYDHCTTPLPCPIDESSFDTAEGKKLLSKQMQQGDRSPSTNTYSPGSGAVLTSAEKRSASGKSEPSRSPSTANSSMELDWVKNAAPNSSRYFLHLVQLARLTQGTYQRLYNPSSLEGSWSSMQLHMKELDGQLETWYRQLPSIFDFRRKQRDRDFYEARLSLGFFYYGTKQMIHRPCLCRLDRKIPNQSNKSQDFNRLSAMACVEAAQETLRLIPDETNAVGLIRVGPWWSIVHWLVQAASILMLEISFRAHHMPEDADSIIESSKKATRWLYALGEDDLAARRAWKLCNNVLHDVASKIGRNVNDLPDTAPVGSSVSSQGWNGLAGESAGQQQTQATPQPFQQSMHVSPAEYGQSPLGYPLFTGYGAMMRHDQYFHTGDGYHVTGPTDPTPMYASAPTDAEMEFMTSVYHDNSHAHDDSHSGQGGMGGGYF